MHFRENKADCILVKNHHNFIGKIKGNICKNKKSAWLSL
jgi:hypothetical protein